MRRPSTALVIAALSVASAIDLSLYLAAERYLAGTHPRPAVVEPDVAPALQDAVQQAEAAEREACTSPAIPAGERCSAGDLLRPAR